MGKSSYRQYTPDFKREAVALADELGSANKAANRLGIPQSNINNWRNSIKQGKLKSSKGMRVKPQEESDKEELKRLRKENAELKKVNFILKRAAAFFSQDHLK